MLRHIINKRYLHNINYKSTCYENIHKLNHLIGEVNEMKEILQVYNKKLTFSYTTNIITFSFTSLMFYLKISV